MPLFEYRCKKCKRQFSLLVGVTREKAPLECPRCGSTKVTKLISRIAPIVRGDDLDDFDEGDFEGADEDLEDYDGDYGEDDFED
jgi:putative FmdB family regulatory protein